ncbi:lead, cadmium, zinc and mercury transporting ATPase [Sporolactobacillus inulinus]|uniref:Lead, cadmium, zinc and mercury transporting ATPase n=1 Tax=Sporolactobacillus inulinus TaxID=2078 RepID=A0A4Y1ZDA4_9BACL|nr:lead, cadmium, zinc and mercury transporting ATPase [Sporolactobacillus inulinus]
MMQEAKLTPAPTGPTSFERVQKICKKHGELIAALAGGLLTLSAYLLGLMQVPLGWLLYPAAYVIGGFYKAKEGIVATVRTRQLNVELLMVTAAIGAACINHWLEGAILIFIFALSGALETYSTAKSTNALAALMKLQPEVARLIAHGQESILPVTKICPGDQILIKPGERIPCDAVIVTGGNNR